MNWLQGKKQTSGCYKQVVMTETRARLCVCVRVTRRISSNVWLILLFFLSDQEGGWGDRHMKNSQRYNIKIQMNHECLMGIRAEHAGCWNCSQRDLGCVCCEPGPRARRASRRVTSPLFTALPSLSMAAKWGVEGHWMEDARNMWKAFRG